MSRFKKVLTGEMELNEIDGRKFVIYPTIEHRMEFLELFKSSQTADEIKQADGTVIRRVGGSFSTRDMVDHCVEVLYEGCFDHDTNGVRLGLKKDDKDPTKDESGTTKELIKADVLKTSPYDIFMEILMAMGIVNEKKVEEFKKKEKVLLKKKDSGVENVA